MEESKYPIPPMHSVAVPVNQPAATGVAMPTGMSNGILSFRSVKQLDQEARTKAQATQAMEHVTSLAAYVRQCWSSAKQAKQETEERILRSLRRVAGQYDPEKLASIREQGGSEIYMLLVSTKCNGAAALLQDALLGNGTDKPWTVSPTKVPEIPQAALDEAKQEAVDFVTQMYAAGMEMSKNEMREAAEEIKRRLRQEVIEEAEETMDRIEAKLEDEQQEGNFINAFSEFLEDLCVYPSAIIKGPVIRKESELKYNNETGTVDVVENLVKQWERVDPMNIYPAPHSASIKDGFLIEHHRMTVEMLNSLIGVDGYDENSIRAVLQDYETGGLTEWLANDSALAAIEERSLAWGASDPEKQIDAIQFWGSVSGRKLLDGGMKETEITDPNKNYYVEIWLIGNYVIKAAMNSHKLGHKPYFMTSFKKVPGRFWGYGVPDLVGDSEDMCNAAARAIANNMGISSGPQVWVDVSRLPRGEDITQMHPWKIWQVERDQTGASGAPIGFFQPESYSTELMTVYEKFSQLADEHSGIPRYMVGGEGTGGAGRTASGMSMMITNAGKTIKKVISNIDHDILTPLITYQFVHNMRFSDDPDFKMGDIKIVAKGATSLQVRDTAQIRRNEFLQATANPIDMQILGFKGRAAVLRESARGLDMDVDKVVPSQEMLTQKEKQMMMQQQQQQMLAQQQGAVTSQEQLADGSPTTDTFSQ